MPYVKHYQGERKQDRRTPPDLFNNLNSKYQFTLDGAASSDNALLQKFSTEGKPVSWENERVFCNPPWDSIIQFVEMAPGAELAVLLVPARVNSRWFHRALSLGAKVEYFLGRPSFSGGSSPFDCLCLVFGSDVP